jgi:hypothetical protein
LPLPVLSPKNSALSPKRPPKYSVSAYLEKIPREKICAPVSFPGMYTTVYFWYNLGYADSYRKESRDAKKEERDSD